MPSSRSDKPIRKKISKAKDPYQLFPNFQEAATHYEIEKTAALVATFVTSPYTDEEL